VAELLVNSRSHFQTRSTGLNTSQYAKMTCVLCAGRRKSAVRRSRTHTPSLPIMKITFCGAAGEVTGSQHLIQCGKLKILLDCGLFQGHRAESRHKNEAFFHDPAILDAVVL